MHFKTSLKLLTVVGPGRPLKCSIRLGQNESNNNSLDVTSNLCLQVTTSNGSITEDPFLELSSSYRSGEVIFKFQLQTVQHWKRFVPKIDIPDTRYPIYGPLFLKVRDASTNAECISSSFFVVCKATAGLNNNLALKELLEHGSALSKVPERKRKRSSHADEEIHSDLLFSTTEKRSTRQSTKMQKISADYRATENTIQLPVLPEPAAIDPDFSHVHNFVKVEFPVDPYPPPPEHTGQHDDPNFHLLTEKLKTAEKEIKKLRLLLSPTPSDNASFELNPFTDNSSELVSTPDTSSPFFSEILGMPLESFQM